MLILPLITPRPLIFLLRHDAAYADIDMIFFDISFAIIAAPFSLLFTLIYSMIRSSLMRRYADAFERYCRLLMQRVILPRYLRARY